MVRGLFVREALHGDHGTWMLRAAAAEPDVVRVEIRPCTGSPVDTLRAHIAARRELERVLDAGGALPPNPDVLLPVTRTINYRAPLRVGDPCHVELEDFSTGWLDRGRGARHPARGPPRVAPRVEPAIMTKPSFRVFVTKHHGGLTSAILLRRWRMLFDPPPPAALAADLDTALARLAPAAALIAEEYEDAVRYLWTEELELRRVEVEIHPGRPDPKGYVIAGATVPIRLGYAAAPITTARRRRSVVPRDRAAVRLVVRRRRSARRARDDPRARVLRAGRRPSGVSSTICGASSTSRSSSGARSSAPVKQGGKAADAPDPAPTLEAVGEDWVALARANRLAAGRRQRSDLR